MPLIVLYMVISIHAPRTGSDCRRAWRRRGLGEFQSTLPARGATAFRARLRLQPCRFQSTLPARGATVPPRVAAAGIRRISIHAPRTGSDGFQIKQGYAPGKFQSTLPARGATAMRRILLYHKMISIHAPRTGSDWRVTAGSCKRSNFNPRSPHGERRPKGRKCKMSENLFQSTLPARGATPCRTA